MSEVTDALIRGFERLLLAAEGQRVAQNHSNVLQGQILDKLIEIHRSNEDMAKMMENMAKRQTSAERHARESETKIKILQETVAEHADRLQKLEGFPSVEPPTQ